MGRLFGFPKMRPFGWGVLGLKLMEFWRFLPPVVGLGAALGRPAVAIAEPEPMAAASAADPGWAALRQLFEPLSGELRAPTSPRFTALKDPGRRSARLLIAWMLPGLDAGGRDRLAAVSAELGSSGEGRLQKRLARLDSTVRTAVTLSNLDDAPLLVVEVEGARTSMAKELELAVLETIAALGAGESNDARTLVQRYLSPRSRVVVAVEPREPPNTRSGKAARPKFYVVKAGDTVAKVARHFGVSEKALLDVNRMEPSRLTPGQRLVLPR
jgi:LysM repeat protein